MDTNHDERIESSVGGDTLPNGDGNSASLEGITTKRKPGRPAGTGKTRNRNPNDGSGYNENNPELHFTTDPTEGNPSSKETVVVQDQKGKAKRGRPKLNKKGVENPGDVSRIVLDQVEQFALAIIGEDGKFQPAERFLLEIGLQNTLTTISSETAEKVIGIISPLSLVVGAALYGLRVSSIVVNRNQNKPENTKHENNFMAENNMEQRDIPEIRYNGFNIRETQVPPYTNLRTDE
jgi:hypothetical protein